MSKICNYCGRDLDPYDSVANFGLRRILGKGTKYSGKILEIDFCCACMEKIIDECKKSPIQEVCDEDC